jgi:hypothetical protein
MDTYRFQVGHAAAYIVEALCYEPQSEGFDSQCGQWIFLLT